MATQGRHETGDGHRWHERRAPHLKIETGESVAQYHCERCGRDFVMVLASGVFHAAYPSALFFYRLDSEVTFRWLDHCPGEHLATDAQDRELFVTR